MKVEYEITDEYGKYVEHGFCNIEKINNIVWESIENGFEIKIAPHYEEE